MRHRIYPLLAALAALAFAPAAEARKCDAHRCDKKFSVKAGETVTYKTPRMAGEADALRLAVNGREVFYEVVPKTGRCRAYGYRLGVVISLSDCGRGRRYIRVKITNTASKRRVVRFGYRVG